MSIAPDPSTPDPETVTLVAALIRHLLTGLSGAGIIAGVTISDSNLMVVSGAIVGLVTIGWSLWQKASAAMHAHQRAVLSATAGTPLQPGRP